MAMGIVLLLGSVVLVLTARTAPNLPTTLGAAGSRVSKHIAAHSASQTGQQEVGGAVAQKGPTAQIITCPACRLNALPKVKTFVHAVAPIFSPALNVKFEHGRDPHLFLYKDGQQIEDIDLAVRVCA